MGDRGMAADPGGFGTDLRRFAAGRLVLAVAMASLLGGCTSLGLPGGAAERQVAAAPAAAPSPPAQSREDSVSAAEHARIVAAYGGIYADSKLEQTVARIVGRLVAASDNPNLGYRVTILNSPAVNAFALSGGYLYVTRGLIALANDSSELAAVLAHEMAHVTADHATQRQDRARTAMIVTRVVTDVLDNGDAGQLALASSQQSLASFSRQQELEADSIGVRTAAKAGYDPYAASRFLTLMSRYAAHRSAVGMTSDKRAEFLSTHPATPARVEAAVRAAREFGAPGLGETDRDRYLAGIDGMLFGDDTGQGYVRGRNFYHASLGVGFTVPEGFAIDNTSAAVLATGPDGTALRFDGVNLSPDTSLEAYLASGWINGLDPSSIATREVNGLPAATAVATAKGWVFRITVIRVGTAATYRFIFANERSTPSFDQAAESTTASFRKLSPQEAAGLKPLRLRLVTARPGDTIETLARRMQGVDRPASLLATLNGLEIGDAVAPGRPIKIVTE